MIRSARAWIVLNCRKSGDTDPAWQPEMAQFVSIIVEMFAENVTSEHSTSSISFSSKELNEQEDAHNKVRAIIIAGLSFPNLGNMALCQLVLLPILPCAIPEKSASLV